MINPHIFDPSTDGEYDFDSNAYYLTDSQIDEASKKVSADDKLYVVAYIEETEKLKRDLCLGRMSDAEVTKKCNVAEDALLKQIGVWAYQTEAYKQFYTAISRP